MKESPCAGGSPDFRKGHPQSCSYASTSGGSSIATANLSHVSSYRPPQPLYDDLLGEPQGEKVPLQALVCKRILEMTIGLMCTSPRWNGRFLIAIITTNIVQCFWATDNTLGVRRSLNSRLPSLQLLSETPRPVLACPLPVGMENTGDSLLPYAKPWGHGQAFPGMGVAKSTMFVFAHSFFCLLIIQV